MDNVTSIKKKLNLLGQRQKTFSHGMYAFLMFMIEHYRRVKTDLKMDFDSFIIIQVVVSHEVYIMQSETPKHIPRFLMSLKKYLKQQVSMILS